ncbi:YigZ family protein [Solitalea sp. MAHUQ-68]|uniref:YigZ family protein n=1 Tax=Solitalea agri TaxID=2953739 RepID=A0A9X2JF08_9SPHI|nr:YigZ family protein [Solitalea agri]MCO4294490.1 YigZ family protein [Solitalea agri]
MLFEDTYQTISQPAEGIFRDRGSKFIAYAFPVRSEDEVKEHLHKLKKDHPTARHHCYAWRFGMDRTVFRVNDDGEPSGTAGRPILNVLLSKDVTNIVVFVVRYFGGTLLGVPGLINAYKMATIEALDSAEIIQKTVNDIYRIDFEYLQMNDVMKVMKDTSVEMLNQQFDNSCSIEFELKKSEVNRIIGKLEDIDDVKIQYLRTV